MGTRIAMLLCVCICLVSQVDARVHTYSGFAARYGTNEQMNARARAHGMYDKDACLIASSLYAHGTWVHVKSKRIKQPLYCRVVDVCDPTIKRVNYPRNDCEWNMERKRYIELRPQEAWFVCGSLKDLPSNCPVDTWR